MGSFCLPCPISQTCNISSSAISFDSPTHCLGVTLATVYADSQTKETFKVIFTEFHEAVERVTGRPLQYIALKPGNLAAIFAGWQLDAETTQWWGLGAYLKTINNPNISGIDTDDENEIALYAAKTCQAHFSR